MDKNELQQKLVEVFGEEKAEKIAASARVAGLIAKEYGDKVAGLDEELSLNFIAGEVAENFGMRYEKVASYTEKDEESYAKMANAGIPEVMAKAILDSVKQAAVLLDILNRNRDEDSEEIKISHLLSCVEDDCAENNAERISLAKAGYDRNFIENCISESL